MKFPITKNSGNKDNDYTPEELFNLLGKEDTGHYLLGNHNFWHGGIHFTNASVANNQPVRCIADGVVVAYRLNKVHKESTFHQKEQGFEDLTLNYSSSFCLVKHEHKSISTRDPEEDVSTTVVWVGKYFILKKDRTVTDTSTLETKDADFVGTLKIGSKIKVLELEEQVKIKDNQKYRLAKVEIISMPQNANIVITKPTKDPNDAFNNLNNIVYIAIFDNQPEMVFINDSSVIEEYTPKESWIGQTVKLSTEIKGVYRYLEEKPALENIINETLTPTEVTPTTQPISEESVEVKYEATLPKGLQIKILAVNETKADVQITRPVNGTLTKKPTDSTAPAETTITTGKTIAIELFQKNDKEEFITYPVKIPNKTDIKEPIVVTATDEASWNDQTVILYQDTQARAIDSTTPVTLLEGTKLTIKEKSDKEADITQTKAILVNNTNVTANGKITTILANQEVYVDLMDQYGNVLQNKEDKEPVITKTPNDKPVSNTLIYYSLYMHLLPGELYTDALTLPNYYIKGKITAQVKLNGLQTYGNDQARTKGAKIQANGKFTYDPSITETITKDNNTLTVTQCSFVSGTFATNTTLQENEIFWAEINDQSVKRISISPPDTDEIIDGHNIAIKEGDPIGYLGLYETPMPKSPVSGISPLKPEPKTEESSSLITMPPTILEGMVKSVEDMIKSTRKEFEKSSKSQVHLEVFVTDKEQLERFMDNKAQIKIGNQYLKLSPNAVITLDQQQTEPTSTTSQSAAESSTQQPVAASTTNQPEAKPEKPVETTYTLLQEHILAVATLKPEEDQGKTWYRVDLIDNKQSIKGRIEKEAANTKIITNHDWRELGFTIVEEEKDNADGFVDKSDMTPFFQNLYAELDDTDKELPDRVKLQKTLTDQHIRQHWSKLIGYHPTEWQDDDAKWSRLDQILKNKELLRHEKERINKLAFWDKVNEIKETPKVCHIHPVAFYEYAPFALEKSDDAVVVVTGKIKEIEKLTDYNKHYGKEIMLYKVLIYNNISYDNYLKYEKEGVLPKPTVTTLTRDSWNSSKRAIYRYGSSNETPPGTYYLLYRQKGFPNKNYYFKITEKSARDSDSITINGPNNKNIVRSGIRIHHYNPFEAEGCLTTGKMKEDSVTKDFFQKIPLFKSHPDSIIRIIIKERKAIKYDDNTYKGVL